MLEEIKDKKLFRKVEVALRYAQTFGISYDVTDTIDELMAKIGYHFIEEMSKDMDTKNKTTNETD